MSSCCSAGRTISGGYRRTLRVFPVVEEIFRRLVAKRDNHFWATSAALYRYPGIRASRQTSDRTSRHPRANCWCRTTKIRGALRRAGSLTKRRCTNCHLRRARARSDPYI